MQAHEQLQISNGANGLEITFRWRSRMAYFLLFFTLVWDVAIIFFLLAGAGWFILIHLLVGLGLTWYVAAQLLNRTHILVRSGKLAVTHGPVPSLQKSAEVNARSISQLRTLKGGSYKPKNGKRVQLYKLALETDDGQEVTLIRNQHDRELLLSLERTIEDHLGITDVPVEEQAPDGQFNPDLAQWNEMKENMPAFLRKPMERMAERAQAGQASAMDEPRPSVMQPIPATVPDSETRPEDRQPADFREGDAFRLRNRAYRVSRVRELDWTDPRHRQSRIIQASAVDGSDTKQFYAKRSDEDWTYYEERPLDADERELLEFTDGGQPPLSLRNGDDRYYGGEPLQLRDGDGREHTYYTTRSATQFRALRHDGGNWEVAVQEPVDASIFGA
jgi:hypothetical protein